MTISAAMSIEEKDNGKTIKLAHPDKPILIRLAGNPTTGYAWTFHSTLSTQASPNGSVSTATSVTVLDADHFQTSEFDIVRRYVAGGKLREKDSNGPMPGAGGVYTFRVTPRGGNGAGHRIMRGTKIALTFKYARPWESGSGARQFSITVEA